MRLKAALLALALTATPALAQPADMAIPPATTSEYPAGVKVIRTPAGPVYADKRGMVLYGMDMRVLIRWSPDPAMFCQNDCAKEWEPMLAPAGSKPNIAFPMGFGGNRSRPGAPPPATPEGFFQPQKAPDWTIIQGPAGPQWVYKGWHVVYTHKGSKRGATDLDGASDKIWNTLKFVPPVPTIAGPNNVATVFLDGAYALTDKEGRVLFTGACGANCASWTPLTGGMASRPIGEWTIGNGADQPQWLYRGKPVYVSQADDPTTVPAGATVLRP